MKTLASGANLFIKFPSVDYKWPSNTKHSHVSESDAVAHAPGTPASFGKSLILFPCEKLGFQTRSCACIKNVAVECIRLD